MPPDHDLTSRWVLKLHYTWSGEVRLCKSTLIAVDFDSFWPCLQVNTNLAVGYQIWFGSQDMSVFYCLWKGIPFHITTMSFRPIALPNELGAPEGLQPLHGWTSAIWPPYCFTASPFFLSTWRGGSFQLQVRGCCTTDWYVHDGMKHSIDVMYVMNYLGASANRQLGGSNSFRSTGRSNCLISQNLDWY